MRIAMIGHKRVPSRSGGVEVVVTELSRQMAKWGHSVMIYKRCYGNERLNEWEGCQVTEIPTPSWEKKSSALAYSLRATLHARRQNLDVLHFHAEGPCAMIPLAKLFGKTCVATIHGLDWKRSKWGGFASLYIRFGERMAARYADRVIVLSKGVQEYFLQKYNRRTTLIPNGVTRLPYRAPNRIEKEFGLKKDGFILFLARITPEKGLHYLIEAYLALETDIPLVVAGDLSGSPAYGESLRKMAKDNPMIRFVGFAQGELLEELFSNCRLYVLPSEIEGMPISLLEAASFRAACLVSDIPENRDAVPSYPALFHAKDAADLRAQMQKLLSEPPKRFPEEEVARMLRDYRWEVVARQTLKEYISARHV